MRQYMDSQSDLLQESYVLSMLHEKKNGYYVELGSGEYYNGNNTWLLENRFGWKGVAVELDPELAKSYNENRANECLNADALRVDYKKYFEDNNFPKQIDFLQIDIDGHEQGLCLLALLALPMFDYRFTVITIEHDLCTNFKLEGMRNAQREILHSLGYKLSGQLDGEDWWVDESALPLPIYGGQVNSYLRHPYVDERVESTQ